MYTEAIIFDYDGTLVRLNINFAVIRQEVERFLDDYGIEPDKLNGLYILEMIEEAKRLISEQDLLEGRSFYTKVHKLVTDHEIRAAKKGKIFPGVMDMLMLLKKRGLKIGIITRNCDKAVKVVFPNIELFCDVFIPRDYIMRVKPHPYHLVMALKEMAVDNPAHCLMVGDHESDIEMGKRMGMKTAGVLTGSRKRQHFIAAGADFILDDATAVLECILEDRES
jgi:phosphoglycolate phosphatase